MWRVLSSLGTVNASPSLETLLKLFNIHPDKIGGKTSQASASKKLNPSSLSKVTDQLMINRVSSSCYANEYKWKLLPVKIDTQQLDATKLLTDHSKVAVMLENTNGSFCQ